MLVARGLKAWIIGLVVVIVIITILLVVLNLLLLLLPLILILIIAGYLFKMLNKAKKQKTGKEYIDVKYKIKK